jgi:hypothetical protein
MCNAQMDVVSQSIAGCAGRIAGRLAENYGRGSFLPQNRPQKADETRLVVGKNQFSAIVRYRIAGARTASGLLFGEGTFADRIVLHRKEEAEKEPPISARPEVERRSDELLSRWPRPGLLTSVRCGAVVGNILDHKRRWQLWLLIQNLEAGKYGFHIFVGLQSHGLATATLGSQAPSDH